MKQLRRVALLCGLSLLGTSAIAGVGENQVIAADDIKWEKGPAEGVKVAKLWGDYMKGGPYGMLVKFKAGHMNPLHSHPHDLRTVILSGTWVFQPEGGKEQQIGPGSFIRQAGAKNHVSGCTKDEDCVFMVTSSDKFGLVPADKDTKKEEAAKEEKDEKKKDAKK
jgi:quercetin dioxygenase-like cupin family protein